MANGVALGVQKRIKKAGRALPALSDSPAEQTEEVATLKPENLDPPWQDCGFSTHDED